MQGPSYISPLVRGRNIIHVLWAYIWSPFLNVSLYSLNSLEWLPLTAINVQIHPTSGAPKGHPEIHLVHRGTDDRSREKLLESRLSTVAWHSDVTYEAQPPGTTFLYVLDKPGSGGDTLFVNTAEAYNRLSPAFRQRLHGLKAVHSGIEQVESARAKGSIVRREPVTNEHPIIRTHPITGEKAIYVNPQCKSLSTYDFANCDT